MTRLSEQIVRVAELSAMSVNGELADRLAAFIGLLAKWNETLNLTGFKLSSPSDEAVARLLVEPLAAGPLLPTAAVTVMDMGSGGGSPALPLKLLRPEIRFVLVESKVRKCAFLREAVRHLELEGVEVFNGQVEDAVNLPQFRASVDAVTVRAVRLDDELSAAIKSALRPEGRLLFFTTTGASESSLPASLESVRHVDIPGTRSRIVQAKPR